MATMTAGQPSSVRSAPATPGQTSQSQLEETVARLREGARRFAKLSLDDRVQLANAMQAGYLRIARASVEAACAAKGIPPGGPKASASNDRIASAPGRARCPPRETRDTPPSDS
jgi:hypothetical protein